MAPPAPRPSSAAARGWRRARRGKGEPGAEHRCMALAGRREQRRQREAHGRLRHREGRGAAHPERGGPLGRHFARHGQGHGGDADRGEAGEQRRGRHQRGEGRQRQGERRHLHAEPQPQRLDAPEPVDDPPRQHAARHAAQAEEQPGQRAPCDPEATAARREVGQVDHRRHHARAVQPVGEHQDRRAGRRRNLRRRIALRRRRVRPARAREEPEQQHRGAEAEPGRGQPHRQQGRHQQRPGGDAAPDARDHHTTRGAAARRGNARLHRRPRQRHEQPAGDTRHEAPAHQPQEAAIPRASRERERHQRHAEIEGARHPEPAAAAAARRRHPRRAEHAREIARERRRPEQPRAAAIHPARRHHGREQRHISEAGEAVAGAGRGGAGQGGAKKGAHGFLNQTGTRQP